MTKKGKHRLLVETAIRDLEQALRVPKGGQQIITGDKVKAARALLGWSQATLAGQAGVSATSVKGLEDGSRRLSDRSVNAIRYALQNAGVEFPEGEPPRKSGDVKRGPPPGVPDE